MTSSDIDIDIKGMLENILSEQINRLLMSGSLNEKEAATIMENLQKEKLMPEQIEMDLAKELKKISCYRYDDCVSSSNRLGGFGWSLMHMQEHMSRYLKLKLQQSSTVLRTVLKSKKLLQ